MPGYSEVVHEALSRLDWALRDVRRPICPPGSDLPDSVPIIVLKCRIYFGISVARNHNYIPIEHDYSSLHMFSNVYVKSQLRVTFVAERTNDIH